MVVTEAKRNSGAGAGNGGVYGITLAGKLVVTWNNRQVIALCSGSLS